MNKYGDFLEKISEDYNTEHKVISKYWIKYWLMDYKLIDYINKKYNRAEQIAHVYRSLFIVYRMDITPNLSFYPENK